MSDGTIDPIKCGQQIDDKGDHQCYASRAILKGHLTATEKTGRKVWKQMTTSDSNTRAMPKSGA